MLLSFYLIFLPISAWCCLKKRVLVLQLPSPQLLFFLLPFIPLLIQHLIKNMLNKKVSTILLQYYWKLQQLKMRWKSIALLPKVWENKTQASFVLNLCLCSFFCVYLLSSPREPKLQSCAISRKTNEATFKKLQKP